MWSSDWEKFWKELLLVTDVSTAWAEVTSRVKCNSWNRLLVQIYPKVVVPYFELYFFIS